MTDLPQTITDALARFDRRRRRVRLLRGIGEATVVQVGALAVVAIIDAAVHPGHGMRTALSIGAWAAGSGVLVVRGLLPLCRRQALPTVARDLEIAAGGSLQERLSSAIELSASSPPGTSPWMVSRTVALAAQEVALLDALALVSSRPARRAWTMAGVAVTVFVGGLALPWVGPLLVRAAWPTDAIARPASTIIAVTPGDVVLPQAGRLDIRAQATPDPGSALVVLAWDDGLEEQLPLSADAGGFVLQLPAVTQGLRYRVLAGDGESASFRVGIAAPPRLAGIALEIEPPAYTGMPARMLEGGDAEIVAGSRVRITAAFSGESAAAASLVLESGTEQALVLSGDRLSAAVDLLPVQTVAYGMRMVGANGILAESAQRWLLTVLPDAAPIAELSGDGVDAGLVGSDERLVLTASASDDLGLRRLELVVSDDAGAELERRALSLPSEPGSAATRAVEIDEAFDLAPLTPELGERLTLRLEATDVGGQVTTSAPIAFSIGDERQAQAAIWAARLRSELAALDSQLEILRQAEKSWSGLVRGFRAEDDLAQRGELLLLASRLRSVTADCAAIATRLHDEAMASDLQAASRVLAHADRLERWSHAEQSILGSACAAVEGAKTTDPLIKGRDLTESAHAELAGLRQGLGLVVARLDAEALVGITGAHRARGQRALSVLHGQLGWKRSQWSEGLLTTVHAGVAIDAPVIAQLTGLPGIQAAAQAQRTEQVSIRWEGEILIDGDGDWEFTCVADDGVRLAIDGVELLPAEAWSDHAPTEYRGHCVLSKGWHRVVLDWFNGGGGSQLDVRCGPVGGQLNLWRADQLRTRGEDKVDARTIAAMANLATDDGKAAGRVSDACTVAASVPNVIARMAEDAGREQLLDLANESRPAAQACASAAITVAEFGHAGLSRIGDQLDLLHAVACRARDDLAGVLDQQEETEPPPRALAAEREIADRVLAHVAAIRTIDASLPQADREAALRRELNATKALADTLADQLDLRSDQLLRTARDPQANLPERMRALAEREELETDVTVANRTLRDLLAKPQTDPGQVAGWVEQMARELDRELAEAGRHEEEAARDRRSDLAKRASAQGEATAAAQRAGDLAGAAQAHAALRETATALAQAEREQRRFAVAEAIERGAGASPEQLDRPALRGALDPLKHASPPPQLADQAARQLARLAEQPIVDAGDARENLDAAATALRLEGERRRPEAKPGEREAFARLADLVAKTDAKAGPEALLALAERAKALAAGNSPADTQPAREATGEAHALEELAKRAQEAGLKPEARAALADDLERAAAAAAARPDARDSAARERQADELERLIQREGTLAAEEQAARQRFAATQRQSAGALTPLAQQAQEVANAAAQAPTPNAPLATAATAVAATLPQVGSELDALGARATDAAVPLDELAAAARAQGERLGPGLAAPLAEAFRAASAESTDEAARDKAAAVGKGVAAAAVAQRAAAADLERVAARRAEHRADLAQALEDARRLGADPAPSVAQVDAETAAGADSHATAVPEPVIEAQHAATAASLAAEAEADADRAEGGDQHARANAIKLAAEALDQQRQALDQQRQASPAAIPTPLAAAAAATLDRTAQAASSVAAQARAEGDAEMAAAAAAQTAQAHAALAALGEPLLARAALAAQDLRASMAAAPAAGAQPAATQDTAGVPAQGSPTAESAPAQPSSAPGQLGAAAAQALAEIRAAPEDGDAYRRASSTLAAAAANAHLASAEAGNPPPPETPSGKPATGGRAAGTGPVGDAAALASAPENSPADQAWGRSQGDLRQDGVRAGVERFSDEHQESIRAYFRRLGEAK